MLIDIMNTENYISFSIPVAQIFGLNAAVYCSELINILGKARRKNKMVDENFFKLDRKYITKRTTLSVEDQLVVDGVWMKYGILAKHQDNPDIINLNVELLFSIVADDDLSRLEKIRKDVLSTAKKTDKANKKATILKSLKNSVSCTNPDLRLALQKWVESIFDKDGYLTKDTIETFYKTLNNYTKGDLDLALRIVEIASIQCYRMCEWAIEVYEKDQRHKKNTENLAQSKLRVSKQSVATRDSINKDLKF